jgi:hypothetical protein
MVQVGPFQLLPDEVVSMVSAQAAVAGRTGKYRADTAAGSEDELPSGPTEAR